MKDFVLFAIGAFLILGSIIFAIALIFGTPFAVVAGAGWVAAIWWVIDFVAFIGGVFLVRHH